MAEADQATQHPEFPQSWSELDRDEVVAELDKPGRNTNTWLGVARWLEVSGFADQSYYYYAMAISLPQSHAGTFGRFFERAFGDGAYLQAQFVAREAVKRFPREGRAWLWVARAAAVFTDRTMFNSALDKAASLKVDPDEIELVRKHTGHFFK